MTYQGEKKNILFLIAHDVGRQFGCYDGQAKTPNIDQLAARGIIFENHFCCYPLCGPSRANLFTGLHPMTARRFDNTSFFEDFRKKTQNTSPTIPEIFKNKGYHSAGIGFVLHDSDPESYSEPEWFPAKTNRHAGLVGTLPPEAVYLWADPSSFDSMEQRLRKLLDQGEDASNLVQPKIYRKARGPITESPDVADETYYDGQVTRQVERFIETYDKDSPFCLCAGFIATHTPYCVPKKYWDRYDVRELVLPDNQHDPVDSPEWASGDSEPAQYYTQTGYDLPWRANHQQAIELLHGHLAAVSYWDAMVGRIIKSLENKGLADNTIIVLTTDHGYHDGEHGYWGKHNMWDKSFTIPLIISVPGSRSQQRINALTEHVDLYPTLCELSNLSIPGHIEGKSLLPVMQGDADEIHEAVIANRKHMWHDRIKAYSLASSIRTKRYRLNCYIDESNHEIYSELFDYLDDPNESVNHINDSTYAETVVYLRRLMSKHNDIT
jgi:arylsulfatase A-like enzyme